MLPCASNTLDPSGIRRLPKARADRSKGVCLRVTGTGREEAVLHAVFIGIKGIKLKSRALIRQIGRLHLRRSREDHRAHDHA